MNLYKAGVKSSVTNYCPISLLSCISKVLERIIYNNIINCISSKVISVHQFGFLPGHSTTPQLLMFQHCFVNSFVNKCQTDVIYLDIQKDFDTISHNILLTKLWNAGITGQAWKFIKAYLTACQQRADINGSLSEVLQVTSGVAQGSILGPLLFLIYIDDLPSSVLHSFLYMFADDSKSSKTVKVL